MGLTSLTAALSGLRIAQQQISVISTNVANVGTPGYTRKILPQSAQTINGVTVGVQPEVIMRNVNLNLTRDLWSQVSSTAGLSTRLDFLNRVQEFHGPPDRELSVASEISRLKDAFAALSDSPEDTFLLSSTVSQAQTTANKINQLSNYINTLRNDAQNEILNTVGRVNDLLVQIASVNAQIRTNLVVGQTTAQLEDQRDNAIQELSGLIEISFFQRGDGVLVVQTNEGLELASDQAQALSFSPSPLSPTTYYPASAAAVYVGTPGIGATAFDITARSPGGKLGALLELRDQTLPQQNAQLDEMAHKLALRLDMQGLRLFTDDSGSIPPDTPPDPFADPPVSIAYAGFASLIRVNQDIISDNGLLQRGTEGGSVDAGSNEVIRRALEFGFGTVNYQQALGNVDLLNTGGADLQSWLGLLSSNTVTGSRDLSAFASLADLITSAAGDLDPPNDQFELIFDEPRVAGFDSPPVPRVLIDLSDAAAFPLGPGETAADQLANYINAQIAATLSPAEISQLAPTASVGENGEIVLGSRGFIEIDSTTLPTGMGQTGLTFLGLGDSTGNPQAPTDPYFDIQIGNADPVRITLEPGDTVTELLAKLQDVPGLAIDEDALLTGDGILRLRPGNDYDDPDFGGDIKITSGPFTSQGALLSAPPALSGVTSLLDGINVSSALFGSFADLDPGAGVIIQNNSPITSVGYQSETYLGSGVFVGFRTQYLGAGVNLETGVIGAGSLTDFGQKMINQQAQQIILAEGRLGDEESLREILETQLLNDSGVNLDEELGYLIVVQTAYAAAARVITAVDELFQELLNAVNR